MRTYGITAMGEILIDFVPLGKDEAGDSILVRKPGGAPLNMLAAAAKRGVNTAFIGKTGNDLPGDFLVDVVKKLHIDNQWLKRDEEHNTTLAFVELDESGDRKFSFTRQNGADRFLYSKDIDGALLENSSVFHFGSLSLTDEPGLSTTVDAVKRARKAGCMISYDPNYRAPLWQNEEQAKERMKLLLSQVDIIKASVEELDMLTDSSDVFSGIDNLHSMGIQTVLITDGKNGAYGSVGRGIVKVEAPIVKCVDTTGAGDIFMGAFLSRMLKAEKSPSDFTESDLREYLQYAVREASMSTLHRGGIEW